MPEPPDEPDAPPPEPPSTRHSRIRPGAGPRRRHGRALPFAGSGGRIIQFALRLARPPASSRSFVLALLVVGGIGSLGALGGGAFQKWSETSGFCSRCHTMAPEARANKLSVHHDVACGECHVGPGIAGLVKSKIRGAVQLLEMVTGTYPKPIPPPDHHVLPAPSDTCMKCHSLSDITKEGSPMKLVLHSRYREDEANTRQTVAVVVRPYRLGEGQVSRGAHWHVQDRVEYASPDDRSQKINWVRVTYRNGRTEEFIARSQVGVSSDVRPDIRRLAHTERTRQMDCISCHNRVGHESPTPDQAVDRAIDEGAISQSLPYVKRDAVARLSRHYRSNGEADRALEQLRGMYRAKYPLVWKAHKEEVKNAVDQLKLIYRLVADPEMNMVAAEYPNNLGHQSGPGCFRCHDGAHFKVGPGGRLSRKTIPWECTTCHTFPQSGQSVSSVSLLFPPSDHQSKLWVFEHSSQPAALQPSAAKSSFCANCHSSGAAGVTHGEMLYHHPHVIERVGLQACAYCHQEVFCARCHKKQVLGLGGPGLQGSIQAGGERQRRE